MPVHFTVCMYKTNESRISLERVSDAVRKRLGFRSDAFLKLSERVRFLVRTRSASSSNAFGFSFERVSYNDRTRPRCRSNAFAQKRVIPCV